MSQPRLLKIFMCHSSTDKPAVRDLYKRLRAVSWMDVWLDEEKLYPGQDWTLEIERAVEDADAILVCLSQAAITKEGYVQREMRIALDYADHKPEGTLYIIPVRLEQCDPPNRLKKWHYASYFPEDEREQAFARLLVSLRKRADGLGILTAEPAPKAQQPPVGVETPTAPPVSPQSNITINGNVTGSTIILGDGNAVKMEKPNLDRITLDGMEFCRVPAGPFVMGSDDGADDEKPQHIVDIPYDYWMGRFTVTNAQYQAYARATTNEHPVRDWQKKPDHPVVHVSWNDAMKYCGWRNQQIAAWRQSAPSSFDHLHPDFMIRLPTEAEWEKAARGIDARIYPWGNDFDPKKCNSREDGKGTTVAVNAYPSGASPYGCEQMVGNVWQWSHSLYNEQKMDKRVLRGGSFDDSCDLARCAYRYMNEPGEFFNSLGFRVALAPAFESASTGAG